MSNVFKLINKMGFCVYVFSLSVCQFSAALRAAQFIRFNGIRMTVVVAGELLLAQKAKKMSKQQK